MNIRYTLYNITFEWNSGKAATNIRKHEISFEFACEAFFDPFVFYLDDEIVNGELRESIIGMTATGRLLHVVYVLHKDIVRVITAWMVTKIEREKYENQ